MLLNATSLWFAWKSHFTIINEYSLSPPPNGTNTDPDVQGAALKGGMGRHAGFSAVGTGWAAAFAAPGYLGRQP